MVLKQLLIIPWAFFEVKKGYLEGVPQGLDGGVEVSGLDDAGDAGYGSADGDDVDPVAGQGIEYRPGDLRFFPQVRAEDAEHGHVGDIGDPLGIDAVLHRFEDSQGGVEVFLIDTDGEVPIPLDIRPFGQKLDIDSVLPQNTQQGPGHPRPIGHGVDLQESPPFALHYPADLYLFHLRADPSLFPLAVIHDLLVPVGDAPRRHDLHLTLDGQHILDGPFQSPL